jgi:hypothetical protein
MPRRRDKPPIPPPMMAMWRASLAGLWPFRVRGLSICHLEALNIFVEALNAGEKNNTWRRCVVTSKQMPGFFEKS